MKLFTKIPKKVIKHLKKKWINYTFETLVVIMGILIAFTLNNWNENRINNKLELQYLNRLINDLQSDTTYYNERIASSEYVIKYHREFIRKMFETQASFEEVEYLFSNLTWNSEQLTTQNVTYIELTNSGDLNILRNHELKEAIILYYRKNQEAAKHFVEYNEFSTRILGDLSGVIRNENKFYNFINDVYNGLDVIRNEDWAFMNDPTSEKFQALDNILGTYRHKHQVFLENFKILKSMTTQLIENIQKDLELKN